MLSPQPYRGQPRPKYPRLQKQVRNLKFEKRQTFFIIVICFLILVLLARFMSSMYGAHPNSDTLAVMIMIFILFLFVIFAIIDGFRSINRFRRGYDIDVSGEAEHEDSQRLGESSH